jgi:hypothetical protein
MTIFTLFSVCFAEFYVTTADFRVFWFRTILISLNLLLPHVACYTISVMRALYDRYCVKYHTLSLISCHFEPSLWKRQSNLSLFQFYHSDENIYQLKVLFTMRPSTLSSIVLIIVNYAIIIIIVFKQKFDYHVYKLQIETNNMSENSVTKTVS